MKKIVLSILLLSKAIGAGTKIERISAERVLQFQTELTESQRKRDTQFKWAIGGVGAAVLAGLIWKGHNNYALGIRDYAEAVRKLDENKATIATHEAERAQEARVAKEAYEAAQANRASNAEWFASVPGYLWALPGSIAGKIKNGFKAVPGMAVDGLRATPSTLKSIGTGGWGLGKDLVKKTVKSGYEHAPNLLGYAGLGYLATQASKFILPVVPSIGDYFMEIRSVNWCLVKHSDFYNVMVNFKNWIAYEIAHSYQSNDSTEIALCAEHLVLEAERILGYMSYVTEALDSTKVGYSFYANRAEVCMAGVAGEVNTLAAEIEALAAVAVTPAQKEVFIDILRKRLFRIIIKLESFEVVTSAAGMASPYEEDVFGALKRFIYPEWLLERPTLQDPNHTFLDDLLPQIDQD